MSVGHQLSNQQASSTWTEPPWSGWIETTGDALLILEAARRGLIPRVTRRLVDSERKMITSGSVFVFDEVESGIKRWTDGFFWSPSRILGNFLLYRETDKRGAGHRSTRLDPDTNDDDLKAEGQSLSRPKTDNATMGVDKHKERTLVGSLTNSYKFKPDGLMKKTFSLTIGEVPQHLISYYKVEDVENGRLRSPSSLPELASLNISPDYLDKTHFRNPPKVEIGADGVARYLGEADDLESPSGLSAPLSSEMPLLTEGRVTEGSASKRSKRYDPYGSPPGKRAKKNTKSSHPDNNIAHTAESISPQPSTSSVLPQATSMPGYATDSHPPLAIIPQHCPPYGVPYISVSNYPAPPPAHMYHPGPLPLSSHQSTSSHIQSQQSVVQYGYPGYMTTPQRSNPSQAGHGTQHGYHPYYPAPPPPPHGYPPYQWPAYSGYPPQPLPVGHPPPALTAPPASQPGHGGNGEISGGQGGRGETT